MARWKARKQNRKGDRACDVCNTRRPLVEHHIEGREKGNARWNTCWVCPNCHDDVHATPPGLTIERWGLTSGGRRLLWSRSQAWSLTNR